MSTPLRLLVLDGAGVLFTNPMPRFLEGVAARTGRRLDAVLADRDRLRAAFWTGAIDEAAWWDALVGVDDPAWRERLRDGYEPGVAASHLPRWSARVPVWLLTNHRSAWLAPRLEQTGLGAHLSRVLVSDRLGAAKPDPAAFGAVVAELGDDPDGVLFVDDKTRNVSAARTLGIPALRADPARAWIARVDARLGDAQCSGAGSSTSSSVASCARCASPER